MIGLDRWPPSLAMLGTRRELRARAREYLYNRIGVRADGSKARPKGMAGLPN